MGDAFMTPGWAAHVAARINEWPDAEYRATKLEDYWSWIDMAKAGALVKARLSG